ncbi:hypothetical protein M413DRAFT_10262 [Hebeloma cylindrosporum]|uniref:Uncharacterized protein n=1 Tax=Hebeloma cylindrosporum TaxID=76867 RepID=A0A0C3C1M3_HEBCY|nr:hypothetical protein M413DRAFT_10262 [Hebeloma cylindrosporum h7]
MSFSVDELVCSFSSSHIGQEAMDLATLQAQLSETLFGGPSYGRQSQMRIPDRGRSKNTQPCNTPIARTRASSFSEWGNGVGMAVDSRHGSRSNSSAGFDDMEEDERMVEELLMPSSPLTSSNPHISNQFPPASSSTYLSSSSSFQGSIPTSPHSQTVFASYGSDPSPSSPSSSQFTTTDPFYLAQLQASQAFSNNGNLNFNSSTGNQQPSVFAQNGRLTQSSPFALYGHGQNWENVSFKPCAAAF